MDNSWDPDKLSCHRSVKQTIFLCLNSSYKHNVANADLNVSNHTKIIYRETIMGDNTMIFKYEN